MEEIHGRRWWWGEGRLEQRCHLGEDSDPESGGGWGWRRRKSLDIDRGFLGGDEPGGSCGRGSSGLKQRRVLTRWSDQASISQLEIKDDISRKL